ncbi:MAG TPA: protoporphyrinogen oxidase [Solirubrobacteraceae bacterium]
MTDVIVIGGGVAGLAATDYLAHAGSDVTLLEATDRLGGNVHTASFAGRPLDLGAEMLVTREPTAVDLCRALSLDTELVAPACTGAFVWTRRGLRPLPSDAVSRLPGALRELLRSRLLSPLGLLRCGWDVIAPSAAPDGDVAIGAIVRSRLGSQVLERIVDPLLGGVHAGSCDTLSARALAPQFIAALESGEGLIRGLRAPSSVPGGPGFTTLRSGLGSLTAALATRAQHAGANFRFGVRATSVHPRHRGRVVVTQGDGGTLEAAACIIATPASAAARLLIGATSGVAEELAAIPDAPTAVVALAYPAEAVAGLPAGTGFLTAGEERLVRACTWSSNKWEHLRGESSIIKAFVGRAGTPPPAVGDRELATAVHRELALALGVRHAPIDVLVRRFATGIPQYMVGHLNRVERIEAALPPPLAIAGASYRGAGISACLRSGQAAAQRVLDHIDVTTHA